MTTKHFYDDANKLVEKALYGVASTNPTLRVCVLLKTNSGLTFTGMRLTR